MNKLLIAAVVASIWYSGLANAGLQEGIDAYQKRDYTNSIAELAPLEASRDPTALYYLGRLLLLEVGGIRRDYKKGVSLIRDSAELGYPPAMTRMAWSLRYGTYSNTKDEQAAVAWLEKASDAGYAEAKMNLADCLATCDRIPHDLPRAFALMEQSSDGGWTEATYRLGQIYLDKQWGLAAPDAARARRYYEAAAKNGHLDAMWSLGDLLTSPSIEPNELGTAFSWFKKAADKGNNLARYRAALMLLKGEGTAADDSAARALLEAAVAGNNFDAPGPLALLRYEGRAGFTADPKAAVDFFQSFYSADDRQNNSEQYAIMQLANIALNKKEYSRPELAFRMYESLARQGSLIGKYAVGALTLQGRGVVTDETEGIRQLTAVVKSNRGSLAALWSGYVLSEQAYRRGNSHAAARLLPYIFEKPFEVQGNGDIVLLDEAFMTIAHFGQVANISWTLDLALKEGGKGPISWGYVWQLVKSNSVESKPDEVAQWDRVVKRATAENPDLLALGAAAKAENCRKYVCKTALSDLKVARKRGSIMAIYVLANLYFGESGSSATFREEAGIAKSEKLATLLLKELSSKAGVHVKKESLH